MRRPNSCLPISIAAGFLAALSPLAWGQTADSPSLTQPFVFTLGPRPDHSLGKFITSLRLQAELVHSSELESIHSSILSQTLDLLRYILISLGGSDGDTEEFSLPAYLRPEYARMPPDAHLFDPR